MAFSIAATTTNKIENYTTPGDVTPPRRRRPQTTRSGDAGHTGETLTPLRPITHESRTAAPHASTPADPG